MCLYIFSFIRRVYFLLLQFLDFQAKDYKQWIGHIGSRKRGRWLLYIYISLVGPKPLRVFEAHDLEHDTMHRGRKFLPSIGPLNRVTLHRRPIILTGLWHRIQTRVLDNTHSTSTRNGVSIFCSNFFFFLRREKGPGRLFFVNVPPTSCLEDTRYSRS